MPLSERQTTRSGSSSNLTFYAILSVVGVFLVVFYVPGGWLSDDAFTQLGLLFLLSWVGMPIAVYADIRTVRSQDVDWQPKAPFWIIGCLLPVANVSVVIPYLLRRYERVNRRESWGYWWRIAGVGVSLLIVLIAVDILLVDLLALDSPRVDAALGEISAAVFLLTTFLVPMAVKYDIAYVERHSDWEPETVLWIAGSAIPFLNVVVVLSYIGKRNPKSPYSVIDDATIGSSGVGTDVPRDDRRTESGEWGSNARREPERGGRQPSRSDARSVTAADVDSNWWYWPAITTGLTGFTVLFGTGVVAAAVADVLSIGLSVILLFVVLLVVLAIVGYGSILAIHYDANAIRETGADWQPSVMGYVCAAVLISPLVPAIVYVVQRHRHLGEP